MFPCVKGQAPELHGPVDGGDGYCKGFPALDLLRRPALFEPGLEKGLQCFVLQPESRPAALTSNVGCNTVRPRPLSRMRYCCSFILRAFQPRPLHFCPCAEPGSSVVVQPDEVLYLIPEILDICEYALMAGSALHLAEPARNRVQPGSLVGVRWKRHRGWTLGHGTTAAVLWCRCCPGSHEGRTRWHSLVELPQKSGNSLARCLPGSFVRIHQYQHAPDSPVPTLSRSKRPHRIE